jgi:hypothetical protein
MDATKQHSRKKPVDKDTMADIPENIKHFRSAIRDIKENILNKTESYADRDIQDVSSLNPLLQRVHQLGTFINMILDDRNNINTKSVNNVYEHFLRNSIDLVNLTDEEKDLCRHYVRIDIFMYPYSPRPGHINSQNVY